MKIVIVKQEDVVRLGLSEIYRRAAESEMYIVARQFAEELEALGYDVPNQSAIVDLIIDTDVIRKEYHFNFITKGGE